MKARRGRVKVVARKNVMVLFNLRMPREAIDLARELAVKDDRPLSAYLRRLLVRAIEAERDR